MSVPTRPATGGSAHDNKKLLNSLRIKPVLKKKPSLAQRSTSSVFQRQIGGIPWSKKNKNHNYALNIMRNVGFYSKHERNADLWTKGDIVGTNDLKYSCQETKEKIRIELYVGISSLIGLI